MEKKEYRWKIKSLAKKVREEDAIKELEHVQYMYGKITAETVLKAASSKKSCLHDMFEWDDSRAAQQYRLQQARILINNIDIVFISENEEQTVPAYEIIRNEQGQEYKNVETFTTDEVEQVKQNTIAALSGLKRKLAIYKQFNSVVGHLNKALEELV